jgi:dTDP-4-amino-4,6-dideoxygalactose transaminase
MEFIPVANPSIGEEEAKAAYDVVKSGWVSMGEKVQEFEQAVCDYTGAKYAVAMNNGTSSLDALLGAIDVGPGDEVIVPSLTYISSANVVLYRGAQLVLCESDTQTFNVEPHHVREKITSRTKLIMVVDLKGMPVDYDAFCSLSEETGIPIIADSAESLGAMYKSKQVGTQMLAHSFSFFANKNITTAEGGMVVTDDEALYNNLKIIRNQGQEGRYNHTWLGNNYRMSDVLAAIGVEQLKWLNTILSKKQKVAQYYHKALAQVDGVTIPYLPDYVTLHSWYNYSIKVAASQRDVLVDFLKDRKIETRLSFPPVHIQPYYQKRFGFKPEDYPDAYQAYSEFIDLPIWADLETSQQDRVIHEIHEFVNTIL